MFLSSDGSSAGAVPERRTDMSGWRSSAAIVRIILLILLAALVLSIVILSLVPPVSKDALVHHLAVPKLYLKHGGMYEIPSMPFSYYPMNVELLYLVALWLGSDILPNFIHFVFALGTAWLLFRHVKRRLDMTHALLAALLFMSLPIIVKLSTIAYVDLGVICFSAASLLLLIRWVKSGFRMRPLLFSSALCGLAMGTKYNGLITFLILTLFVPFLYSRYGPEGKRGFRRSAAHGLVFMMGALIVFSPWMIRNAVWTGNPMYPQYDAIFNPDHPFVQESVPFFTFRQQMYGEKWWQIVLLPLRVFFQGRDGSPQLFDGRLNPFLLFLPLLAVIGWKRDSTETAREKKILLAFAILYFAFAFLSSEIRVRYLAPIIPPLVILSVYGVKRLEQMISGLMSALWRNMAKAALLLLVGFFLCLNAVYVAGLFRYVAPFPYLRGEVSRDVYISHYRAEYQTLLYANQHLPEDARILFFFTGRSGYYCDRDYLYDIVDDRSTESLFRGLTEESESSHDLLRKLKEKGITHVLINHSFFDDWTRTEFSDEQYEMLKTFFKTDVELLLFNRVDNYGLSRVKEASEVPAASSQGDALFDHPE